MSRGPDRAAIERGRRFEEDVATIVGGRQQPGSGNQWHARSDVRGSGLLVSCKSEIKRSWGRTQAQLTEAIDCAVGTGLTPALAIEDPDSGERVIVMRLRDFADYFADGGQISADTSRAQQVAKRADVPLLLRTPAPAREKRPFRSR